LAVGLELTADRYRRGNTVDESIIDNQLSSKRQPSTTKWQNAGVRKTGPLPVGFAIKLRVRQEVAINVQELLPSA
jgi:hypothetical protein